MGKPIAILLLDMQRCPQRAWDESARIMKDVYATFKELGIPTIQASRLRQYRDALATYALNQECGLLTQGRAELLLQLQVELPQLRAIVRAATSSGDLGAWEARLRLLASGSPLPRARAKNRDVRDVQFECLLAAVAVLSGFQAYFGEPDVILKLTSADVGIAAKCPRTTRAFAGNVRSAAKQVRRTGRAGLIAVNLSQAMFPQKCVHAGSLREARRHVQMMTDSFLVSRHSHIKRLCHDADVLGVLACITVPAMIHTEDLQIASATRWTLLLLSDLGDPRAADVAAFVHQCNLGLFGPRTEAEPHAS